VIHTTLKRIRRHNPCNGGWRRLLSYLGKTAADNEPLSMSVILESNGLPDALWCCRSVPEYSREWRLFSIWLARSISRQSISPICMKALGVAESFANEGASNEELCKARVAVDELVFSTWSVHLADRAVAAAVAKDASTSIWVAYLTAYRALEGTSTAQPEFIKREFLRVITESGQ